MKTAISRIRRQTASDQRGFSLVELLVVMLMMLVVLGAIFGLITSSWKAGNADINRNTSLDDQTVAFSNMLNEIRQAYQVNCPTAGCSSNASSNYIDFDERIVESGSQVDRRVSYVCNVAQPGASGQYECVRYEAPASDTTDAVPLDASNCSACLSAWGGSSGIVKIQRVLNTSVFSNLSTGTSPSGTTRWVSGKAAIYTPGAGSTASNISPYTNDLILQQNFSMPQLGFGQ